MGRRGYEFPFSGGLNPRIPKLDAVEYPRPYISNLSLDPQGCIHRRSRSSLRRWWRAKRGWTHYA